MKALKAGILDWVKKHTDTDGGKGPEVTNIKDNFADGTAFLRILHRVNPEESPYNPRFVVR